MAAWLEKNENGREKNRVGKAKMIAGGGGWLEVCFPIAEKSAAELWMIQQSFRPVLEVS